MHNVQPSGDEEAHEDKRGGDDVHEPLNEVVDGIRNDPLGLLEEKAYDQHRCRAHNKPDRREVLIQRPPQFGVRRPHLQEPNGLRPRQN